MFGQTAQHRLEAKAAPLAYDLRDQYGPGAAEVCRAALTVSGLPRERRRILMLTLQMLDGATP